MNDSLLPSAVTLATMVGCMGIVACAAVPDVPATTTAQLDCTALEQQLQRAAGAEREAAQQQRDAWQAVVPIAVFARAANGKAAVAEQQQRQADLRAQAAHRGCGSAVR
jgi:hypothetical protein